VRQKQDHDPIADGRFRGVARVALTDLVWADEESANREEYEQMLGARRVAVEDVDLRKAEKLSRLASVKSILAAVNNTFDDGLRRGDGTVQ
jgi:hypothetical protein